MFKMENTTSVDQFQAKQQPLKKTEGEKEII